MSHETFTPLPWAPLDDLGAEIIGPADVGGASVVVGHFSSKQDRNFAIRASNNLVALIDALEEVVREEEPRTDAELENYAKLGSSTSRVWARRLIRFRALIKAAKGLK